MTSAVLAMGIGAGLVAMTTATHAATPMTLPFGDVGFQAGATIQLPVPPAPQVARPDVSQMRLIIKPQPRGCGQPDTRRPVGERREVEAQPSVKRFRLG